MAAAISEALGVNMIEAQRRQGAAAQNEYEGIRLIGGERIEASLGMGDVADGGDALLLTDRRIVRIGGGRDRQRAFAALDDVSAAEIARQPEGYANFVWAALGFLAALLVWLTIDSPPLSWIAAAVLALMGAYLVIDRLVSRGSAYVAVKAGPTQIFAALKDADIPDAEMLINRLFELKAARADASSADASEPDGGRFGRLRLALMWVGASAVVAVSVGVCIIIARLILRRRKRGD